MKPRRRCYKEAKYPLNKLSGYTMDKATIVRPNTIYYGYRSHIEQYTGISPSKKSYSINSYPKEPHHDRSQTQLVLPNLAVSLLSTMKENILVIKHSPYRVSISKPHCLLPPSFPPSLTPPQLYLLPPSIRLPALSK